MVHDFCVIIGVTNVVDSIVAVHKVVFEDKKASTDELLAALDANWVGYEDLRQMMIRAPKFGNDDDLVDDIAVRVHHGTSEVLAEFTDRFGYPCRGDGSGVSATYGCAFDTPATPDGRGDGEPFADATLSPSQGRDVRGPTAVLKSAAKIDTTRTSQPLAQSKILAPNARGGSERGVYKLPQDVGRSWHQSHSVQRVRQGDAPESPKGAGEVSGSHCQSSRVQRLLCRFEQRLAGFDHSANRAIL